MLDSWAASFVSASMSPVNALWQRLRQRKENAMKDEVARQVRLVWPADVDLVMAELDSYAGPERARVQLNAIALSNGSLEDLKRWIKSYDFSDVISAIRKPDDESEIDFRDL